MNYLGKVEIIDAKEVRTVVSENIDTIEDAANALLSDITDPDFNLTVSVFNDIVNDFNEESEVRYSDTVRYVILDASKNPIV
jgi:hypothetical protein